MNIVSPLRRTVLGVTTVAVVAAAGAVVTATPAQASTSTLECASVITIVVRGTDEAGGTKVVKTRTRAGVTYKDLYASDGKGMGLPKPVAVDYQKASAKGVRIAGLNYAAANLLAYAASQGNGAAALVRELNRLSTACPSSRITLVGFSQGAHVIGDALAKSRAASKKPTATAKGKIKAIALYGDPVYNPSESFAVYKGSKKFGMLGTRGTGELSEFQSRIQSYCYATDPACQGSTKRGGQKLDALNNATGLKVHRSYFDSGKAARTDGVAFLKKKTG